MIEGVVSIVYRVKGHLLSSYVLYHRGVDNDSFAEYIAITHRKDILEVEHCKICVLIVLPDNGMLDLEEMNFVSIIVWNPITCHILGDQEHHPYLIVESYSKKF